MFRPSSIATRRLTLAAMLLLAGLLTGCNGLGSRLTVSPNDTDWQTSSTYASATAGMTPHSAVRSARLRLCDGAPCGQPRVTAERTVHSTHRAM
jgi:hypothetical protein